jgi:hypothetical protein
VDENNGDQPLSSEEMLRRARAGLGETDSTPPPSAPDDEPYSSIESEMDIEMEPVYENEEAPVYPAPEPMSYEPPTEPAPPTPVADDTVGHWAPPRPEPSNEGSGGWAPPATQPDDDSWTDRMPSPQPSTKPRRSVARIVFIIAALIIGGVFAAKLFDSSKTVDQLAVGDCMNIPEGDEFSTVDPLDCTEPHDLEVFAMIDMSTVSAEFSIGTEYPGGDSLYNAAVDACSGQPFESYVGVPYSSLGVSDTLLWVDAFTPTLQGWRELDDREVQCILLRLDSTTGQVVKSTTSFKNSGGV